VRVSHAFSVHHSLSFCEKIVGVFHERFGTEDRANRRGLRGGRALKRFEGYFHLSLYGGICSTMQFRQYQQLIVWQEAHKLCLSMYKLSGTFPSHEKFNLVNQMRRSAYSVPMNLAEGNTRRIARDKKRFFEIALGSLEELHYQCMLARDLHYCTQEQFSETHNAIQRVSFLVTRFRSSQK
jgi:four helix bundle protein